MQIQIFSILSFALVVLCACTSESKNSDDYLPSSWEGKNVISLCDTTISKTAPPELVNQYHGSIYHNKNIKRAEHQLMISFDFISACCSSFNLDYEIQNDILTVFYEPNKGNSCDCFCNYRAILDIGDKKRNFNSIKRIKIKKRLIK